MNHTTTGVAGREAGGRRCQYLTISLHVRDTVDIEGEMEGTAITITKTVSRDLIKVTRH